MFFSSCSQGCEVVKVQMTSILIETGSIFRFYNCVFQVLHAFIRVFLWIFGCLLIFFNLEEHSQFGGRASLHFKSQRTSSP